MLAPMLGSAIHLRADPSLPWVLGDVGGPSCVPDQPSSPKTRDLVAAATFDFHLLAFFSEIFKQCPVNCGERRMDCRDADSILTLSPALYPTFNREALLVSCSTAA